MAKGIPRERIAVGGFSQGGHIALKSLFKAKQPLAACIALSTWLEPGMNLEVMQTGHRSSCKSIMQLSAASHCPVQQCAHG